MDERTVCIPGWHIVRTIGRGGFGTVYEIERDDEYGAGMRSALKVISIPENSSEITNLQNEGYDYTSITKLFKSRVEDITSEFHIMEKLKGTSNIVSYEDHQIVQHDNDPGYDIFIRMELLTALPEYYQRHMDPLHIVEKFVPKLGVDICSALELCRHFNIIHRDIKPQNIFVNELGDYKLGDFGIAKTSDHTTRATKTGTFSYMAPEVYLCKPYNASVDLCSLGLVMYWMLNERRGPFLPLPPAVPTSADHANALARRMSGEPLPAPKHGSEELKRIVLKACAFDPKDRYADPTEMKRDLEQLIDADPFKTADPEETAVISPAFTASETADPEKTAVISPAFTASETADPEETAVISPAFTASETADPEETAVISPAFTASEIDRTSCQSDHYTGETEILRDENTANRPASSAAQQWKYCIRCGARMRSDNRFCQTCGAVQDPSSDQKQPVPDPVIEKKKPSERSGNAIRPDTASEKKDSMPKENRKTNDSRPKKKLWIILAAALLIVAGLVIGILAGTLVKNGCEKAGSTQTAGSSSQTKTSTSKVTNTPTPKVTNTPTPKVTNTPTPKPTNRFASASVGDTITFGSYEQDNNLSNGEEKIEWIVLAKESDRILVISKYALDCQQYNETLTDVSWATCTLREWLNGTFLNAAFSADEQKMILKTTVTADQNPSYDTPPGSSVSDKIFILSMTEVNRYFSSKDAKKCAATDYAIAQGAYTSGSSTAYGRATCWWWLRSPGDYAYKAVVIKTSGSVYDVGYQVYYTEGAVRPALWISLGS